MDLLWSSLSRKMFKIRTVGHTKVIWPDLGPAEGTYLRDPALTQNVWTCDTDRKIRSWETQLSPRMYGHVTLSGRHVLERPSSHPEWTVMWHWSEDTYLRDPAITQNVRTCDTDLPKRAECQLHLKIELVCLIFWRSLHVPQCGLIRLSITYRRNCCNYTFALVLIFLCFFVISLYTLMYLIFVFYIHEEGHTVGLNM